MISTILTAAKYPLPSKVLHFAKRNSCAIKIDAMLTPPTTYKRPSLQYRLRTFRSFKNCFRKIYHLWGKGYFAAFDSCMYIIISLYSSFSNKTLGTNKTETYWRSKALNTKFVISVIMQPNLSWIANTNRNLFVYEFLCN